MLNKSYVMKIAYTGEAVDDGIMDIKALAPALLALGEVIEESNRLLNGNESKMKIAVRADIRKGSFELAIELAKTFSQHLQTILSNVADYSAAEVVDFLGGIATITGVSLVGAIKWLRNRPIKSVKTLENGNVIISVDDEQDNEKELKKEVYVLLKSINIRKSLNGVFAPLERNGIETFQFRSEERTTIVEKQEKIYFSVPEEIIKEEELESEYRIGTFTIIGISFEEGLKWRLTDGESKFHVSISDTSFLEKIETGEVSFRKGDLFRAKIKTTQKITTDGKLKINNELLEVIEFIRSGEQLNFNFPEE